MDAGHIEELLPFYALDALTEEERELVEKYLAEHPEARQQVEEMEKATSALPYGVAPVEPSQRAKQALMARVTSDAQARVPSSAQTRREPSRRRVCCTMRSIAEAICSRSTRTGRSRPDIRLMVSKREMASRGVLACSVVSEPS